MDSSYYKQQKVYVTGITLKKIRIVGSELLKIQNTLEMKISLPCEFSEFEPCISVG